MRFKPWLLMLIVLSSVVFAHKVELTYSTDQCLTDCYSIYKLTAEKTPLVLDEQSFWFEFKNSPSKSLSHARDVSELKSFVVEALLDKNITVKEFVSDVHCAKQVINGTEQDVCNDLGKDVDVQKTVKAYQTFSTTTVPVGESVYVKISGKKKVNTNIDNVLVLYNPEATITNGIDVKTVDGFVKYNSYAWWNSSWLSCRQINITNPTTSALNNFPVLLQWNASVITNSSKSDGSDLRFTNGTDCNNNSGVELPFEIEYYSNATNAYKNSSVYTIVNLTASGTSTILMYYNNPLATLPLETASNGAQAVWSPAGYSGVYHMSNNSFADSTNYNRDGTNSGTVNNTGIIIDGREGDTNTDYILYGDYWEFRTAETFEGWIKRDSVSCAQLQTIIAKYASAGSYQWELVTYDNAGTDCDYFNFLVSVDGTAFSNNIYQNNILTGANTWYYVAIAFDVGTSVVGYVGNTTSTTVATLAESAHTTPVNTATNVRFMNQQTTTTRGLDGVADEYRWSESVRSIDWINASFLNQKNSYAYNSFGSEEFIVYDAGITIAENYTNPVYETSTQYYYINYSWSGTGNVTNVSSSTLYLNGTAYNGAYVGGNSTQSNYAIDGRIPLVALNNTNINFYWTYNKTLSNMSGGALYNTTTHNQSILYAYLPLNIFMETPIIETHNTTWNTTTSNLGNNTDVTFQFITQWNNTNITGLAYENNTAQINASFSYVVPFITTTLLNTTINMTPYINVTFNGSNVIRNGSAGATILSATQQIYRMVLTNCSNETNTTTNQFYIRDSSTLALLNANSILNYSIWLTENTIAQSRNYSFTFTTNSSPRICVYPTFAIYNSTTSTIFSATGYTSSTPAFTDLLSNTSINHTIYLTNTSLTTPFTYYVVDSSENPLNDYTIDTYLYYPANASEYLVSTVTTDITGSVVAFLILNNYYKWIVYDATNTSVLAMGPTYLLSTATSKTFIIGENASTGLDTWITLYGLNCSVTWDNTTNLTSFVWNASGVNLTQACFNLFNLSGGDYVLFAQNCSANLSGSLTLFAGYSETSWLAYPVISLADDNASYILYCGGESPLSFSTITTGVNAGVEGVFWAMILLILVATIGLMGEGASYISMMLIIAWVPAVSIWNLIPWGYSTIIGIISFLIIWIMGLRRERG